MYIENEYTAITRDVKWTGPAYFNTALFANQWHMAWPTRHDSCHGPCRAEGIGTAHFGIVRYGLVHS